VVQARIEDVRGPFDACTARALAPPPRAWGLARRLLRPGGVLVLYLGSRARPEDLAGVTSDGSLAVLPRPARSGLASASRQVSEWLDSAGPVVMITRT